MAMVAIFLQRRVADGLEGGGELRGALGGLGGLAQDEPQPGRALLRDVAVVGDAVAATDGRREPGPGRELARRGEPARVADLGEDDQSRERADPGQLGQHRDPPTASPR